MPVITAAQARAQTNNSIILNFTSLLSSVFDKIDKASLQGEFSVRFDVHNGNHDEITKLANYLTNTLGYSVSRDVNYVAERTVSLIISWE